MKKIRILILFMVIALITGLTMPVYAQLGTTDVSSFTIQNVDSSEASVTVVFIADTGTRTTPTTLNSNKPNPFTLQPNESFEVYVPGIPGLNSGRYSVEIDSTAKVVAIANISGSGNANFNGSYSGFNSTEGASTMYLPAIVYNYYGWYSLISVQNMGESSTDITVSIKCDSGKTGTLSQTGVAAGQAVHFVLKTQTPSGLTSSDSCNGSATVTSTGSQPIAAVDVQSVPAAGNTQSYSGVANGAPTLYVPALYNSYYGWNSSINVRKINSGNVTVNVTFSDNTTTSVNLTDAQPGKLVYIPNVHPGKGYFGATLAATGGSIVAVVNAANGAQAQTYNAVAPLTTEAGIPSVMKSYYGWNTSVTCQNMSSSTQTSLHLVYQGYDSSARDTKTLTAGEAIELYTPAESFLPNSYQGGLTVTANNSSVNISCIVNFNNSTQMAKTNGDWSMSYNAFNR